MSDLYWLTDGRMARLQPYFPKSHCRARVDDRRVLRWRDAPKQYGLSKTFVVSVSLAQL